MKGDYKSLDTVIQDRLKEIVIMSDVIARSMKMKYIAPFHEESVKKEILSIPIQERMKEEGEIKTKYPLRKSYEGILPQSCITRPQTMAFTGSGIYETIKSIGSEISDTEFMINCKNIFHFRNKFEYALFKIYSKIFEFKQEEKDLRMTSNPIFTKRIRMGDLNIFEKDSNLSMEADFYILEILDKKDIEPNDLPALLEIPIKEFIKLEFTKKESLNKLQEYYSVLTEE